jgi:hypothetical protein
MSKPEPEPIISPQTSESSKSGSAPLVKNERSPAVLNPEPPTLASPAVVKSEPIASASQPEVFVIDDSPSPPSQCSRSIQPVPSPQVKTEVIDLDAYSPAITKGCTIKQDVNGSGPRKKIKLEPEMVRESFKDDEDLLKLEQDALREEAEIAETKRLVDMMRKNNETRAKIEALKAKKNGF